MIDREDERLLWNYLDDQLDEVDQAKLLSRFRSEPALADYFLVIQDMDRALGRQSQSSMSEQLKVRIKNRLATQQKPRFDTANFQWKNLRPFAFFNLLILGAGLLYLFGNRSAFKVDIQIWSSIYNTLDKPIFQTFFFITTGLLTLLIFDQYLKRRLHHGTHTPV